MAGTAADHNSSQLAAGGNGTLSVSHGLVIIPHARLEHHPPHRKGSTGARRQRPPHALPPSRPRARARTPPRIGSTGQPTPAALRALKTKTLGEATRPTRPRSLPAPARDPARSDRDPEFPELPFGQPARPWMMGWGGGGSSRGRPRARGLTSPGGRARRHVTPPRAVHSMPPIGAAPAVGSDRDKPRRGQRISAVVRILTRLGPRVN